MLEENGWILFLRESQARGNSSESFLILVFESKGYLSQTKGLCCIVLCLVTQSCLTLCDPVDCSLPGCMGIFCPWRFPRQEDWSGLACPPPGDLPDPGIQPRSLASQVGSFLSEPPGKPREAKERRGQILLSRLFCSS